MPYLNAHGIPQHYEMRGDGPALVFVHGALVDQRSWKPQVDEFQSTHQVLSYDLRGHGQTGPSDQPTYSVQLFADDLRALLDALAIERPYLCGLSLGGMIAQAYAVRYPVSGLVLADTLFGIRVSRWDVLYRKFLYPRWFMSWVLRRLGSDRFAGLAVRMAQLFQGPGWLGTRRGTLEYVRECLRQLDNREALKTIEAVYEFEPQPLETIESPALVLLGEHEAGIVRRHTSELVDRLKNARANQIPGAGHISNLDNPSAFNQRLHEFLAGERQ